MVPSKQLLSLGLLLICQTPLSVAMQKQKNTNPIHPITIPSQQKSAFKNIDHGFKLLQKSLANNVPGSQETTTILLNLKNAKNKNELSLILQNTVSKKGSIELISGSVQNEKAFIQIYAPQKSSSTQKLIRLMIKNLPGVLKNTQNEHAEKLVQELQAMLSPLTPNSEQKSPNVTSPKMLTIDAWNN